MSERIPIVIDSFSGSISNLNTVYMIQNQPIDNNSDKETSFISVEFNITSLQPNPQPGIEIEIAIMSQNVLNSLGYLDGEERIVCCDTVAVRRGLCSNPFHIFFPNDLSDEYSVKAIKVVNGSFTGQLFFQVPKTGLYSILVSSCDYRTSQTRVEAIITASHPYGYLPAYQKGSLSFSLFLAVIYTSYLLFWIRRCVRYQSELMTIHYFILIAILTFLIDSFIDFVHLSVFNMGGSETFLLSLHQFFSCLVRTLTRVLALFICMGLGITKTHIDKTFPVGQVWFIACIFFMLNELSNIFERTISNTFWLDVTVSVASILINSILYYWIVLSYLDTLTYLRQHHQHYKIKTFLQIRQIFVFGLILMILGRLLLSNQNMPIFWKLRWFGKEGIWNTLYCIYITSIMILWRPTEHASAYTHHMQLGTEEQSTEGFDIPLTPLVQEDEDFETPIESPTIYNQQRSGCSRLLLFSLSLLVIAVIQCSNQYLSRQDSLDKSIQYPLIFDRSAEDLFYTWNSTVLKWNGNENNAKQLDLVLTTTIGGNSISRDTQNTLMMFDLFQQHFNFKAVVFSSSPAVIDFCRNHSLSVVTQYRVNPYGMPLMRYFFVIARQMFPSKHYGYINSDILVTSNIFSILHHCEDWVHSGKIKSKYVVGCRVYDIVDADVYDKDDLASFSLHDFDSLLRTSMMSSHSILRNRHSSDIFIFSSETPLLHMADVVVGRIVIDNHLLQYAHDVGGSMVDASFEVTGLHQGACGFRCHTKNNNNPKDLDWNRQWTWSPRLGFGTLVNADARF